MILYLYRRDGVRNTIVHPAIVAWLRGANESAAMGDTRICFVRIAALRI